MKYKLYTFPSPSHHYSKEIRGIRFDYQYHLLPEGSEYIAKEYDADIDGIPLLFHKEDGVETNYPSYIANESLTDIVPITIEGSKEKPHYAKIEKKRKLEKLLEKEAKKELRQQKKSRLTSLKNKHADLVEVIDEHLGDLDKEDTEEQI